MRFLLASMTKVVVGFKKFIGRTFPISPRQEVDCWLNGFGVYKLTIKPNDLVTFEPIPSSLEEKCLVYVALKLLFFTSSIYCSQFNRIKDVADITSGCHIFFEFIPFVEVFVGFLYQTL